MQDRKKSISFLNDKEVNTMEKTALSKTLKNDLNDEISSLEENEINNLSVENHVDINKNNQSRESSSILKTTRVSNENINMKKNCDSEIKRQKKFSFFIGKRRLVYLRPKKSAKKVHISKNDRTIQLNSSSSDEIQETQSVLKTTKDLTDLKISKENQESESHSTMLSNLKPIKICNLSDDSNREVFNKVTENTSFNSSKMNSYANPIYLVEIRAVVLKLGGIDTLNEKFYAEAFIEAKWIDRDLEPNINYNSKVHWNPQLYVLNSLGESKEQIWFNQYSINSYEKEIENNQFKSRNVEKNLSEQFKQDICRKLSTSNNDCDYSGGSVIVERRRISGQFWQTLDLKSFPADVQHLTITLTTPKQANEINIVHRKDKASSVNTKCFVDSQCWRLYKHINVNEFLRDSVFSSETFPAIDLTIHAARRPTFYYLNAFFLIFLITVAGLSIFSIRCHLNQNRIQTTCTLLLTSVTFKWITNRSLPTISYMTSLDKYSMTCILLLCAQCVWHSIISSFMGMEQKCVYPFNFIDHVAFLLFCIIFLLIHLILVCWLVKNAYKKRQLLNKQELDFTNEVIGKRSTRLKSMLYGI